MGILPFQDQKGLTTKIIKKEQADCKARLLAQKTIYL